MKFINVQYRFTNVGIRELRTTYLNEGNVVVAPHGYYYSVWSPLGGIHAEKYNPRLSTVGEISALGGDAAAFETLSPGHSITGHFVFEIAEGVVPIEAEVDQIPVPFSFDRGATTVP